MQSYSPQQEIVTTDDWLAKATLMRLTEDVRLGETVWAVQLRLPFVNFHIRTASHGVGKSAHSQSSQCVPQSTRRTSRFSPSVESVLSAAIFPANELQQWQIA